MLLQPEIHITITASAEALRLIGGTIAIVFICVVACVGLVAMTKNKNQ